MSIVQDLKILYHLALAPVRGKTHRDRLESFYAGQAAHYDAFRKRLLHGRRELYERTLQYLLASGGRQSPGEADALTGGLTPPARPGLARPTVWLEMGGGTGANLEYLGPGLADLHKVYVVDLSPSLLKIAEERGERHGWNNVVLLNEDAATVSVPEPLDVVTFSYSLTMIPNWYLALENASKLLRPGGLIAVVDFYVARKHPLDGFRRHSAWTRRFWPAWFSMDNVFPSPDHLPYLHQHFEPILVEERSARLKFLPLAKAPYYLFMGRKLASDL